MFGMEFAMRMAMLSVKLKAKAKGREPTSEEYHQALSECLDQCQEADTMHRLAIAKLADTERQYRPRTKFAIYMQALAVGVICGLVTFSLITLARHL